MIISFGHEMRQGKDTSADYLVDNHGFVKMSFAKALKEEISDPNRALVIYNKTDEILHMWHKEGVYKYIPSDNILYKKMVSFIDERDKEKSGTFIKCGSPEKDRAFLQIWGTDYRRDMCGRDYWVDIIRTEIEKNDYKNIAFADMRFENEADFVKSLKGLTVNISGRYYKKDGTATHASENNLNGYRYDYKIINNGTLDDLHNKLEAILRV